MSSTLHIVEGKLTGLRYLERPDQDSSEDNLVAPVDREARRRTWGYWFTHSFVPMAAVLTGNAAAANSVVFQQTVEDSVLAKLDAKADTIDSPLGRAYANIRDSKTYVSQNASVTVSKDGHVIEAKLPVEVEVDGKAFRGILGGQCFQIGDDVAVVVDKGGRLFAISSSDRQYTVLDYTCGNMGFAGLVRINCMVWKWMFIAMSCLGLPALGIALWTSDNGFSDVGVDLLFLVGMPISWGVLLALILGVRLSWSDWVPAWRTSAIFHALGRPDLCKRDFLDAHADAKRDGKVRDSDIGTIYYALDAP